MKQLRVGLFSQLQYLWKTLLFIYLPIVFLFLVVGFLSRVFDDFTLSLLMRDLVIMGNLPIFAGLVPQVEAILWSASLSVCIFTLVLLQRRGSEFIRPKRFLLQFAIITAVLMFDDIFLFHGEIAPKYLHINKMVVIAGYLIMIIVFMASNWTEILSSEYLILMLALGMFATSTFLDALPIKTFLAQIFWEQLRFFLEDGIKFAGTATWLTYLVRYAIQKIEAVQVTSSSVTG